MSTYAAASIVSWTGTPDKGWAVVSLPEAVRERLIGLAKPGSPVGVDPAEAAAKDDENLEKVRLSFVQLRHRSTGGLVWVSQQQASIHGLTNWRLRGARLRPSTQLPAGRRGRARQDHRGGVHHPRASAVWQGRAFLILVPAAVLRQWQEELAEKISLRSIASKVENSSAQITDRFRPQALLGMPFQSCWPRSHLARRRDRFREVLTSGPWDMVLLDEAHHARRQGGKPNGTPNQLLKLLHGMRDEQSKGPLPGHRDPDADAPPRGMGPCRVAGPPRSVGERRRSSSFATS